MIIVASSNYILCLAVCGTVGVGHRSCGGWSRGVDGVRRADFLVNFRDVGWGHSMISRHVIAVYRVGSRAGGWNSLGYAGCS